MSRFRGFSRVASGFDPTEIRMTVAALEGAGFTVLTPGVRLNDTLPHISLAFGPVEVLVPEHDAEEARALLHAIADGHVRTVGETDVFEVQDEPQPRPVRRPGWIGNLLGFVIAGVSRPLKGVSVDRARQPRRED